MKKEKNYMRHCGYCRAVINFENNPPKLIRNCERKWCATNEKNR